MIEFLLELVGIVTIVAAVASYFCRVDVELPAKFRITKEASSIKYKYEEV